MFIPALDQEYRLDVEKCEGETTETNEDDAFADDNKPLRSPEPDENITPQIKGTEIKTDGELSYYLFLSLLFIKAKLSPKMPPPPS